MPVSRRLFFENTPKYLRRFKGTGSQRQKSGPKIVTLMCDAGIYDLIQSKEVKATVSGIYITAVKGSQRFS